MTKSEIFRKMVRLLTILGGLLGFLFVFSKLFNIEDVNQWIQYTGISNVISTNIGMVIACFAVTLALKPDNPIPWHWITLMILSALIFVFIHFLPAILVIGASIIELVREL